MISENLKKSASLTHRNSSAVIVMYETQGIRCNRQEGMLPNLLFLLCFRKSVALWGVRPQRRSSSAEKKRKSVRRQNLNSGPKELEKPGPKLRRREQVPPAKPSSCRTSFFKLVRAFFRVGFGPKLKKPKKQLGKTKKTT